MEKVAVYYVSLIDDDYSNLDFVKIEEYCKQNNYEYILYTDIVKDRNITEERNELDRLKRDITDGKYPKILISSLTNISKNVKFNLSFITYAEDNNCKIISIDKSDPHQYKKFIDTMYKKLKEE